MPPKLDELRIPLLVSLLFPLQDLVDLGEHELGTFLIQFRWHRPVLRIQVHPASQDHLRHCGPACLR